MPKDDPINVRLNKTRGKSVTVFGAISTDFKQAEFMLAEKTTILNFKKFLDKIRPHIKEKETVMILDNHSAHKSVTARNYAHKLGIKLCFLPPTASELNPIERMWSYFKNVWRRMLYNPCFTITDKNS